MDSVCHNARVVEIERLYMKEVKKAGGKRSADLDLDSTFKSLEENLTHLIDTLDDIKALKPARKELKRYRTAICALQRQVRLFEKEGL